MAMPTMGLYGLPPHLKSLVEGELDRSERLEWIGRPIPGQYARGSIPIVIFAIPWTAFALFWIGAAAGFEIPDFREGFDVFPVFGLPFLFIGLAMLASPFWMLRKGKRTVYVLTDQRAIIFDGGSTTNIRSFKPEGLADLERRQRADGSGDVLFKKELTHSKSGNRTTRLVGFIAIPNVKDVEARIRRMVEDSRR